MKKMTKFPDETTRGEIQEILLSILKRNPKKSFSAIELAGFLVPSLPAIELLLKEQEEHGAIDSKCSVSIREYRYVKPVIEVNVLKKMAREYLSKKKKPVIITGMLKKFNLQPNKESHQNLLEALNQLIAEKEVESCVSRAGKTRFLLKNTKL